MNKLAVAFWGFIVSILACGLLIYFLDDTPTPVAAKAPTASAEPARYTPPAPTPWRFPAGAQVGDLVIGGMTDAVAAQSLEARYAPLVRPLTLRSPAGAFVLRSSEISLTLDVATTLEAAHTPAARPLLPALVYDQQALAVRLESLAPLVEMPPTVAFSATAGAFVLTPGVRLDQAASLATIEAALRDSATPHSVALVTSSVTDVVRPSADALTAALADLESDWGGMIGVSYADLHTETAFAYHGDTVFSGMSVLKIPILLQAFISRTEFTKSQLNAIDLMIQDSDNDASNELLEMIGDGDGLAGVRTMNATLGQALGVEFTRLTAPFESIDYLNRFEGIEFADPGPEGPEPYTNADPYVRATPDEMVAIVKAIVDCSAGSGPLLKLDASALTAERCTEMLAILATNKDINKIVAGVPETAFVAHKSGWIDDCRADAGYVRTAAGNEYVVALWVWEDTDFLETEVSDPLLAAMSRIVYTALEPIVLEH